MFTAIADITGLEASAAMTQGATPALHASSDHALMLAVRDGELAKLGVLFLRHRERLFGFFLRLTRHRATSEDLVQLVFYRILRYRHTYRDVGSFPAWMYHIARRTLIDFRRHALPLLVEQADGAGLEASADDVPDAAETAEVRDETRLLQRALELLSADDRELLVLARFQELPHADIAVVLNLSVGAVKVRVHRAMKALRHAYLKICDERPRVAGRPPVIPQEKP